MVYTVTNWLTDIKNIPKGTVQEIKDFSFKKDIVDTYKPVVSAAVTSATILNPGVIGAAKTGISYLGSTSLGKAYKSSSLTTKVVAPLGTIAAFEAVKANPTLPYSVVSKSIETSKDTGKLIGSISKEKDPKSAGVQLIGFAKEHPFTTLGVGGATLYGSSKLASSLINTSTLYNLSKQKSKSESSISEILEKNVISDGSKNKYDKDIADVNKDIVDQQTQASIRLAEINQKTRFKELETEIEIAKEIGKSKKTKQETAVLTPVIPKKAKRKTRKKKAKKKVKKKTKKKVKKKTKKKR